LRPALHGDRIHNERGNSGNNFRFSVSNSM
jgi:hypothetical protein